MPQSHPSHPGPEFMTITEAAEALGVSRRTMDNYVARGWLQAYRPAVGVQTYVKTADVEARKAAPPVPIAPVARKRGRRPKIVPPGQALVAILSLLAFALAGSADSPWPF